MSNCLKVAQVKMFNDYLAIVALTGFSIEFSAASAVLFSPVIFAAKVILLKKKN